MQAGTLHRTRLRAANGSPHVTDQGRRPIDTCGRVGGQGQKAGSVRPARARGQEGGPAPGKGSRHGAAHTRRHTSRTRPRQPLHGFRAEAPANLKRKDHQPAARVRAKELRVCVLLGPSGLAQGCALGSDDGVDGFILVVMNENNPVELVG